MTNEKDLFITPEQEFWRSIVRSTVLGLLEPWTTDDLEYAVKNNIQLATLIKADETTLGLFRNMSSEVPTWASYFTIEYVLDWFISNREDFSAVLKRPDGREWLRSNVQALKELVWGTQKQPLSASEVRYIETLYQTALKEGRLQ